MDAQHYVSRKCTQAQLLLPPFFKVTSPSVLPFGLKVICKHRLHTWCDDSLLLPGGSGGCLGRTIISFSTRPVIKIASAEHGPNANITVHFFHSRFVPSPHSFPSLSVLFCSVAHTRLNCDENHGETSVCEAGTDHIWSPSLIFFFGGERRGFIPAV